MYIHIHKHIHIIYHHYHCEGNVSLESFVIFFQGHWLKISSASELGSKSTINASSIFVSVTFHHYVVQNEIQAIL